MTKTKALIALGISVATRCDGCIAFHAEAAVRQGATRDEVMETMGMAIYMGAGPSVMYAARALEAFDPFTARAAEQSATVDRTPLPREADPLISSAHIIDYADE